MELEAPKSTAVPDILHQNGKIMDASSVQPKTDPTRTRRTKLPEKDFQLRQSVLTELLEVPHFKTIHHIFVASLALIFLHSLILDFNDDGIVDLGLQRMMASLGEVERTWTLLVSLHASAILVVYPGFSYWAYRRQDLKPNVQSVFDKMAAAAFGLFLVAFVYIPGRGLLTRPLPFVSALVTGMEQGRLIMKMYAFVRSNVPRALRSPEARKSAAAAAMSPIHENGGVSSEDDEFAAAVKKIVRKPSQEPHNEGLKQRVKNDNVRNYFALNRRESWLASESEDQGDSICPGFTKYLYFLFAPTLVYSDNYPRTKRIRWNYVCWNFAQVVGCFFYGSYILNRFCSANLQDFGKEGHVFTLKNVVEVFFALMLPGSLTLLLMFFAILHAWQNAFAEMLYFGDRLFYKDWWNCSSFAAYYKTWNVLVHDWLYTYIFKDAWESGLVRKWKPFPTVLVFLASSLFHEYILMVSFNFFFPALLFFFGGFGFVFVFVGNKKENSALGNFLVWMALMSGTGIIIACYAMEVFARRNCLYVENHSFFVPRVISCNAIELSWR